MRGKGGPGEVLQASTSPAIEHLSFASDDSCTESTAEDFSLESYRVEPSSLEQAMIPQQAMKKEALWLHTPAPLPADADATATGTDILYPARLQPQPVEWLWQHRHAAGTLLDDRIREDGNFHWTGLSNLTPGDLFAPRPTGAGLACTQKRRDCRLSRTARVTGMLAGLRRDGVTAIRERAWEKHIA